MDTAVIMPRKLEPYFVYILRCVDETFYTGVTNNVARRFAVHQSGKGAKYTRAHPPLAVVYVEQCKGRGRAQTREAEIKRMSHAEKRILVQLKV